jgi:Ca2+-binding RTX toxin-like protein
MAFPPDRRGVAERGAITLAVAAALAVLGSSAPAAGSRLSRCPPSPGVVEVDGTRGPDRIIGTAADEIMRGFDGTDVLAGLAGSDCLFGGRGDDRLGGGESGDLISGGGGGDVVRGGPGDDSIESDDYNVAGGGDGDLVSGGPGNDLIEAEGGDDVVHGGRGNDFIGGGPGRNRIDAGPGNDFVSSRNGKAEVIRCGRGFDKLSADRSDKPVGCERVIRQRSPWPTVLPHRGTDTTRFVVRFENVSLVPNPYYATTVRGPCGSFALKTLYDGKVRAVGTLRIAPRRFGRRARWCTGTYRGTVQVSPGGNQKKAVLFGRFNYRVR